jgi:hypothetical protein
VLGGHLQPEMPRGVVDGYGAYAAGPRCVGHAGLVGQGSASCPLQSSSPTTACII